MFVQNYHRAMIGLSYIMGSLSILHRGWIVSFFFMGVNIIVSQTIHGMKSRLFATLAPVLGQFLYLFPKCIHT